eukprot:3758175-Alexandrium_andersonii.AAC.1
MPTLPRARPSCQHSGPCVSCRSPPLGTRASCMSASTWPGRWIAPLPPGALGRPPWWAPPRPCLLYTSPSPRD